MVLAGEDRKVDGNGGNEPQQRRGLGHTMSLTSSLAQPPTPRQRRADWNLSVNEHFSVVHSVVVLNTGLDGCSTCIRGSASALGFAPLQSTVLPCRGYEQMVLWAASLSPSYTRLGPLRKAPRSIKLNTRSCW